MAEGPDIKALLIEMENRQMKKFESILEEQKKSSLKLEQLHSCVVGNETYGQQGLVSRMNEAETDIEKFKDLKNKGYGAMAILTLVWVVLVEYVKSVFK